MRNYNELLNRQLITGLTFNTGDIKTVEDLINQQVVTKACEIEAIKAWWNSAEETPEGTPEGTPEETPEETPEAPKEESTVPEEIPEVPKEEPTTPEELPVETPQATAHTKSKKINKK